MHVLPHSNYKYEFKQKAIKQDSLYYLQFIHWKSRGKYLSAVIYYSHNKQYYFSDVKLIFELQIQSLMSKPKKIIPRPNLVIETSDLATKNDDPKDEVYKNQVFLKPLRSEKNLHQIKQFSFQEANIKIITTERRLSQLHQLEKEKIDLVKSLHILKESAVEVIAIKSDQIQRLKGQNSYNSDQTIEFYQNQLQKSQRLRKELQEERQQLHRQMCEERFKYISELQQKEFIIQTLYEQIQQIRHELEKLEQTDLIKKQKIKQLREENIQLSVELELSNLPTRRSERLDMDQSNKFISSNSGASSVPNHSFNSMMQSDHFFQSEADKAYMNEILEEIDRAHRQEISDLRQIYEKKIINLRELNEIDMRNRMEESERERQSWDNRSRSASTSSKVIIEVHQPPNQQQDPLEINLNLNQMYSIEQKVEHELETSRQDIKNMNYENNMRNLSECPSLQPYTMNNEDRRRQESIMYQLTAGNNQDNVSQFTINHFQNPFRVSKNNLGTNNIDEHDDEHLQQVANDKQTDTKQQVPSDTEDKEKTFDWQKPGIFAAGLISGISLTSLVGFIMKKI